jgi:hypothetical protein
MNRREFLASASASVASLPFLSEYSFAEMFRYDTFLLKPPVVEKPVKPQVAVSLSRLLDDAKSGRPARFGMTRIDGYVSEGSDVVLFGRNEPKEEEVLFDDFVVIYRSIMQKYGKGIPSVSLDAHDPNANIMIDAEVARLGKIKHHEIAKMKDGEERNRLCREVLSYPRVTALPPDSRVAKDLLDADQHMKLVGCGVEKLNIKNPFPSYVDMRVEAILRRHSGKATEAEKDVLDISEGNSSGRMWFEPGRMSYLWNANKEVNSHSVYLDCVQVTCNDQLNPFPELNRVPEGENLFWKAFAIAYTNRMDDIIPTRPEYMKMRNHFRLYALSKVMLAWQEWRRLNDTGFLHDPIALPPGTAQGLSCLAEGR